MSEATLRHVLPLMLVAALLAAPGALMGQIDEEEEVQALTPNRGSALRAGRLSIPGFGTFRGETAAKLRSGRSLTLKVSDASVMAKLGFKVRKGQTMRVGLRGDRFVVTSPGRKGLQAVFSHTAGKGIVVHSRPRHQGVMRSGKAGASRPAPRLGKRQMPPDPLKRVEPTVKIGAFGPSSLRLLRSQMLKNRADAVRLRTATKLLRDKRVDRNRLRAVLRPMVQGKSADQTRRILAAVAFHAAIPTPLRKYGAGGKAFPNVDWKPAGGAAPGTAFPNVDWKPAGGGTPGTAFPNVDWTPSPENQRRANDRAAAYFQLLENLPR